MNSEAEEIRRLLLQVAPERSRDIDGLFAKYPMQFERVRDTTGFAMATSFGVVLYNDRAFQQIYLISFLAWKALIEQSGGVLLFENAGRAYDHGALGATPSQREAEQAADAVGTALRALRNSESLDHASWPPDLPYPTLSTLPFKDKQQQAVYEIAVFAVAYILLHEIRHAMFAHDGDSPDGIAEERECDTFALRLLLDGTREFAAMRGNPPQAVLSKRAMGVFLGQAVIAEITPAGLWNVETDHPTVTERFAAALAGVALPPDDSAWMYAACFLLVKLRQRNVHGGAIAFTDYLDLCGQLLRCFR